MVNPKKIKSVDRIAKELANYPVVGVVNMENLPAMQLQKMKRSLWGKAELTMARKKLLARALEKLSNDKEVLEAATNATAHLYITNPFKGKDFGSWFANIFNTHPPIEERIKRLRAM